MTVSVDQDTVQGHGLTDLALSKAIEGLPSASRLVQAMNVHQVDDAVLQVIADVIQEARQAAPTGALLSACPRRASGSDAL